jgi:subtilisin family serine protease
MNNFSSQKKKFPRIIFSCFIAFVLCFFVPLLAPDGIVKSDKRVLVKGKRIHESGYVEGEVLVKFKPRVSRYAVDAAADSSLSAVVNRFKALTNIDESEYAHFKSKIKSTQQLVQELAKNPQVEAVSPNFVHHVGSTIPDDENFDYLWALHNTGQMGWTPDIDINAPEAWDISTGSSDIIVGIIDTGIDYNHPDLIPNLWINPGEIVDGTDNDGNGYIDDIHGINAITASGDPMDDHSHGTHCAGTIGAAGNNNLGVTGINWNVKLIGTKFLDAAGYGTDADALECINYLIDLKSSHGQNIVAANASFGGGDYNPVFESAIENMGTVGIIFCAAAGNDWQDNDAIPHYPSSYSCSNIIAVTAVDWMGWQNFNYGATSVDLGAPGVDILSTISAVYYPQPGDIFFDDMESGAGNWITGGVNNSWAISTDQEIFEDSSYPVPSPPHFWSDSPGVNYLPETDSWLMNASDIDLSGYVGQNIYLGFGSAMLFEQGAPVDHGYVEVSGDGGITWQSLMDFTEYGYYWYIPWYFSIPDSVKTANFRFRFHLVTDSTIEYNGWLIDDVGIGTADYYGYGFKSGTSMAAPHVTGAVALLASQHPSETVTERINRILDTVSPNPSLIDTCVTEGMLNLFHAISLPGIPKNPSPPDTAVDISVNTMLEWDDCAGADAYDVYFGTSPSPSLVGTVSTSSYNPGTLSTDMTYYWQIVAKNSYGEATGSEWQFTTQGILPAVPENPTPVDGATEIETSTDLDWDDCPGATSYDVYLGISSPPVMVDNVSISRYVPGTLDPNTQYFWKIVAINPHGQTPGSEWQFTTETEVYSHLLWAYPDSGWAHLWTLNADNQIVSTKGFALAAGWSVSSYFRNPDGTGYLLWTHPVNGWAHLWTLNADNQIVSTKGFALAAGWGAVSYHRNGDGTSCMLWADAANGWAHLWTLNADNQIVSTKGFALAAGWSVSSYFRGPDGTGYMLWTHPVNGWAHLWTLNADNQIVSTKGFALAAGWAATSYHRNADGTSCMLWTDPVNGWAHLWTLNASLGLVTTKGFSLAAGWWGFSYFRGSTD